MQMEHFNHKHPLSLSKYNNSPPDALCNGCKDPILLNTYAYHCIDQSTAPQYSLCHGYFLHKTCAELPPIIQHHLHPQHVITLGIVYYIDHNCEICHHKIGEGTFFYKCSNCVYNICSKCAILVEREIDHPSHNHPLTLLPFRATLFTCTACGTEGSKLNDFSYVCLPCCFWIHKSCAFAPATLTHKDHHNDHPLVLAYSLPVQYRRYRGVTCSLCPETITYIPRWLYYCDICRYFAHVQCALSAPESAKDGEENDDRGELDAVHFPVSGNELYQLIQQFANKFTISSEEKSGKADVISECRNGHSLALFDDFNDKSVVETNSSDKRICDGCVLPLLSTPDPFYGCLECNFFLHNVCASELPRAIQHTFIHPKKELTTFTRRCFPSSKPSESHFCNLCHRFFNGIVVYSSDEYGTMDIVCAALPSKIKHDSHRHTLHQVISDTLKYCRGCGEYIWTRYNNFSFGCEKCDYYIDIRCALQPRRMKHRWDEHEVNLVYPPVKGHPHDFDCEFCSEDINPNLWFYHCSKCDTSFHTHCIYPSERFSCNFKYGGIVRDDSLHQHGLKITKAGPNYPRSKCCRCGEYKEYYPWKYKCESCKFTVCRNCFIYRRD